MSYFDPPPPSLLILDSRNVTICQRCCLGRLDHAGMPWNEVLGRYREESLARISAHIGHPQSGDAQARGAALMFDEAIKLAIASR